MNHANIKAHGPLSGLVDPMVGPPTYVRENQDQKKDGGKPPMFRGLANYFPRALEQVAKVSAMGHAKYGEWGGWRKVDNAELRYRDALVRHILMGTYEAGDPESGLLHAAHAAWNALAVLEMMLDDNNRLS